LPGLAAFTVGSSFQRETARDRVPLIVEERNWKLRRCPLYPWCDQLQQVGEEFELVQAARGCGSGPGIVTTPTAAHPCWALHLGQM